MMIKRHISRHISGILSTGSPGSPGLLSPGSPGYLQAYYLKDLQAYYLKDPQAYYLKDLQDISRHIISSISRHISRISRISSGILSPGSLYYNIIFVCFLQPTFLRFFFKQEHEGRKKTERKIQREKQ